MLHTLEISTAPALSALELPRYVRELRTHGVGDTITVEVDKLGFRRYKRHCPFPRTAPPAVDIEGIKTALNCSLPPSLKVVEITDGGTYIQITMEELL